MATATLNGNGHVHVDAAKQFDRSIIDEFPSESMEVSSLGEGLKLTSRRNVELDHELSTWLLELPEFDPDRALDNKHVLRLKSAMERGTFLPEMVSIITCVSDGKEYRMNGQHTSWARLEMPKAYRCPIVHMRYRAETENDMRRLYASVDRLKPRTMSNVVVSYLYGTPEWDRVTRSTLKRLSEGLACWLWENETERGMRDGDHRCFLLMTDHYELGKKIARFLDESAGSHGMHVCRSPAIAAMFATFSKSPSNALEFWVPVRDGVGFGAKTDPRLVLRNGLMGASIGRGRGAGEEKKSIHPEEMYRWCVQSWNAWRRDEPLKLLKALLSADRSKVI